MGLFGKKSEEEELVNTLVGGFLTSGKFFSLARINGLKDKVDDQNEDTAVAYDIENILKSKVKKGELSLDEIELYFYFIFKQAMYINQNLYFKEGYCSNCKVDMEDEKYHLFSCPRCGKDFFDSYIIDYDELDKIEIKFPDDGPYRDLGDDLSKYIQKHKPDSNYEKIKQHLPRCLEILGVSENECYLVEVITKINSDEYSPIKLAVMAIYDDKVSFIPLADSYRDSGYLFYEDGGKEVLFETHFKFDEIEDIVFPSANFCRIHLTGGNIVLIQYLKTKTSLEKLVNNLVAFKEKEEESQQDDETVDISDELPDDVNPMQKIKEAKELLDIGAISQEEFDEIKTKYMKFI